MTWLELTALLSAVSGLVLVVVAWRRETTDPTARRISMALGIWIMIAGIIVYLLAARSAHAECFTGVNVCDPVNPPVVKPGDLVSFGAELCTTRGPDENVSMNIITDGSNFMMTIGSPSMVFQYVATGYDDLPQGIIQDSRHGGQDGCTVTVFSANHAPRMSAMMKGRLQETVTAMNVVNLAIGVLSSACALDPDPVFSRSCQVILAAIGAVSGTGAIALQNALTNDPPDPAYGMVAKPSLSPRPRGIPLWARPLIDNERRIQALCEALYTAVNRVNTAVDAGDAIAEDLQQGAIDTWLRRLRRRFADEIELRRQIVRRFGRRGFDASALADPALLEALAAASAAL